MSLPQNILDRMEQIKQQRGEAGLKSTYTAPDGVVREQYHPNQERKDFFDAAYRAQGHTVS